MKYIEFKKRVLSNIGADLLFIQIDDMIDMEVSLSSVVVDGLTFTIVSGNTMTLNVVANLLDSLTFEISDTSTVGTTMLIDLIEQSGIVINESLSIVSTVNTNLLTGENLGELQESFQLDVNVSGYIGTRENMMINIPLAFETTMTLNFQGDILTFSATVALSLVASTISLILGDALNFSLTNTLTLTNTLSCNLITSLMCEIDGTIGFVVSLTLNTISSQDMNININSSIGTTMTIYAYRYALLNDYDSLTLNSLDTSELWELDYIL